MTNGLTDGAELDALFSATYEQLRHIATSVKRRQNCATLNPTALVHEAWIKLSISDGFAAASELHFKRIAARAMRQILIDNARRQQTAKRGGPGNVLVTMDLVTMEPASEPAMLADDELLALDRSLDKLAQMNPRQAAMVECRFFGGLEMTEIAEFLGLSQATVLRDWRAAKAWLAQEVRRS